MPGGIAPYTFLRSYGFGGTQGFQVCAGLANLLESRNAGLGGEGFAEENEIDLGEENGGRGQVPAAATSVERLKQCVCAATYGQLDFRC